MPRLQGKVAAALGGSGGIGGAIADGFAREGAQIAIIGRTPEKVETSVAKLRSAGCEAQAFVCDLRNPESCATVIGDVAAHYGRLDILLNSQGVTVIKPAVEHSVNDYDDILTTNLKSVFFTCLAAYHHMRQGGGSIINIGSLASHAGWPLAAAYAASKHGVIALTKTFASEWANDGVRVNSISPGFYLTDLNRARMSEARKQSVIAHTPMGRFGEVNELVGTAMFLASDDSAFVTGIDIAVDGGYLAKGI